MNTSTRQKFIVICIIGFVFFFTLGSWLAYYLDGINAMSYLIILTVQFLFILVLTLIYFKHKKLRILVFSSVISYVLFIVMEVQLLQFGPLSHIVYGYMEPEEIVQDSSIYVLGVSTAEFYYADDALVERSYLAQTGTPALEKIHIDNALRYQLKNDLIFSTITLKKDEMQQMKTNLTKLFFKLPSVVDDFTSRENSYGNSAGLALALSILVGDGELKVPVPLAVTGAIDAKGNIEPITAIKAKMLIAQQAGFAYFMLPLDNFEEANEVKNTENIAIKILPVATLQEAISEINKITKKM